MSLTITDLFMQYRKLIATKQLKLDVRCPASGCGTFAETLLRAQESDYRDRLDNVSRSLGNVPSICAAGKHVSMDVPWSPEAVRVRAGSYLRRSAKKGVIDS